MKMVGAEFTERVTYYRDSWMPARQLVAEALKKRMEVRHRPRSFVFLCVLVYSDH